MRLVYTQLLDTDQVLYALSLLQAVLYVDPATTIGSLATSLVNTSTYGYSHVSNSATGDQSSTGQKSLLEVILLSLAAFVRSEYPPSLDVTPSDEVQNLRVKSAAVEMTSFFLLQFSLVLSSSTAATVSAGGGVPGSSTDLIIHNPSYVSALVTLCDVQKVLLVSLSQVFRYLRSSYSTGVCGSGEGVAGGTNEETPIVKVGNGASTASMTSEKNSAKVDRVLFVHLLRCLHNLISLEAQCIPASPAPVTPSLKRSLSSTNHIHPGLSTATQPFFEALLTDILADSSLPNLHVPLLHMFSAALPNLSTQLDSLVPKILRQLCRNLETSVHSDKRTMERVSSRENFDPRPVGCEDGTIVVGNVHALVNIIHYFLFGEFPTRRSGALRYNPLNRFWDASCLGCVDNSEEAISPTSKQQTAMSWLFGVFAQNKAASSPVGAKSPKLGLSHSKSGQSILLLLPAVYNALTEVWTWFNGRTTHDSAAVIRSGNDRGISLLGKNLAVGNWLETEKKRAEYNVRIHQQLHTCYYVHYSTCHMIICVYTLGEQYYCYVRLSACL